MQEVIQQLIQAEEEARRIVEAARAQGEQILAVAQKQAQYSITSEQAAIHAETQKWLEMEVQRAELEKQQMLAEAEKEINERVELQPAVREELVEAAVRCVCRL